MNPEERSGEKIGGTKPNLNISEATLGESKMDNKSINELYNPAQKREVSNNSPKDVYEKGKRAFQDLHIIADAFKPTMNKWIEDEMNLSHEKKK